MTQNYRAFRKGSQLPIIRRKAMKRLLVYTFLVLFTSFFASLDISAKGRPTVDVPEPCFGAFVECVDGYEAYSYDLVAGQVNDAGTVTITTDGEYFTVIIDAYSELEDVHVYVYEEGDPLPTSRPTPGHAPYMVEDVDGNYVELMIPVGEGDTFTFAVHVAFEELEYDPLGLAGETAYAFCLDNAVVTGGGWFYLVSFMMVECDTVEPGGDTIYIAAHAALTNDETAWALGQVTFIDAGIGNNWGWYIEIEDYGVYEFDIYYGAGGNDLNAGTLIGTLTVDYSSEEIVVTYELDLPLLEEAQVYVGYTPPTTAAPGSFDYKVENLGGVYTYTFTILVDDLT